MRRAPIRLLARLGTGHTPSRSHPEFWAEEERTIPWLTLADVWQLRDGTTTVIRETAEKITPTGVANSSAVVHPAGTVVLSRTASVGFSCILGDDMATSQDFVTWTCGPHLDPRFLLWVLRGERDDIVGHMQGSTHKTIYMSDIERLTTPVPDIEEQRRIAAFLDVETERIDQLIATKTRMIEISYERFESLVYSMVTNGLGTCATKGSGHSWVGEIPDTWGMAPVGAFFDCQLGKMLNAEASSGPDQFPYLRNTNIQWDRIDTDDLASMHFNEQDRERCDLRIGDVLVCEGGEVGRAAVWVSEVEDCYYQKAVHRLRQLLPGTANPRFLMYCFRAAANMNVFVVQGNLSTIVHLTGEQLCVQRFPWPPLDEQGEIVESLDRERNQMAELTAGLGAQMDLLRERRRSLIMAAVTGEMEVP